MKIENLDPITRTIHATAVSMGHKTDPAVLEEVREILKNRDAANAHLATLGRDRISPLYEEQMRHGVATIGEGKPDAPCKRGPYQTKSQIGESLMAERQAVKRGLEDLNRQLTALIRPEAARFTEDALEMIAA